MTQKLNYLMNCSVVATECGSHQDTDGLKAQGHSTKDLSLMLIFCLKFIKYSSSSIVAYFTTAIPIGRYLINNSLID